MDRFVSTIRASTFSVSVLGQQDDSRTCSWTVFTTEQRRSGSGVPQVGLARGQGHQPGLDTVVPRRQETADGRARPEATRELGHPGRLCAWRCPARPPGPRGLPYGQPLLSVLAFLVALAALGRPVAQRTATRRRGQDPAGRPSVGTRASTSSAPCCTTSPTRDGDDARPTGPPGAARPAGRLVGRSAGGGRRTARRADRRRRGERAAGGGAGGVTALARRAGRLHLVAVETVLRDLDDLAGNAARVVAAAADLPPGVDVFVGFPAANGTVDAVEVVEAAGLLGGSRWRTCAATTGPARSCRCWWRPTCRSR